MAVFKCAVYHTFVFGVEVFRVRIIRGGGGETLLFHTLHVGILMWIQIICFSSIG